MDVMKKLKVWRLLGKFVNNDFISKQIHLSKGIVNKLVGLSAKKSAGPVPWTPFAKPLSQAKICLVTTAGVHLKNQPPFDVDAAKGDHSFRIIPSDFKTGDITISHEHFSHARAKKDLNVIFPRDRLLELVKMGVVGRLSENFYSFGFGAGLVKEYIAPPDGSAIFLADLLLKEGVDYVIMVPA